MSHSVLFILGARVTLALESGEYAQLAHWKLFLPVLQNQNKSSKMKNIFITSVIFYNAIQLIECQPQNGQMDQNQISEGEHQPMSQSWVWGTDLQDTLDNIRKQAKERQRIQNIMDEFRRKHQEQNSHHYTHYNGRIFFKLIWVIFVIIPLTCFCFCKRHRKPQERQNEGEEINVQPVMQQQNHPSNVLFIISQGVSQPNVGATGITEQPPSYEDVVKPSNNQEEPPSYEETIEQQK